MGELLKRVDKIYIYLLLNIILVVVLTITLLLPIFKIQVPISVFRTVSIIALIPVILGAYNSLKQKEVSVDFLAAIALVFSFLAKEWYSATFINLMLSSARIFDLWTQKRSDDLVKNLLKYRPERVKVKSGDQYIEKNIDEVKVNDIIIIEAGERIAVDGIVISGQASIDEATLTGESTPKTKKAGDHVYSSTLNTSGSLLIKAEKTAGESTLAKIIILVSESTLKKSKTIRTVSVFAQWYIIATLGISLIIYFAGGSMILILSILLVACADDIAVSIPLTFTAAIARAAQDGILIKSSDVLEKLHRIDIFVTDKTGTLTYGRPKIVAAETFGIERSEFLKLLGTAEANSSHPIAEPILTYVKNENIKFPAPTTFHETPGEGIEAKFKNANIICGKVDFLKEKMVTIEAKNQKIIEGFVTTGHSITALSLNKKLTGFIAFEDEVRPEAKDVIAKTRELGTKLWIMLTGDNHTVAKKVADAVGLDRFETNLKPSDKPAFIEKIKKEKGGRVAMIGDGVNDAAALSIADIGFAMGAIGSDVAINASDVALMNDDLTKIPEAIILGQDTKKIISQNFAIWGITNAVGLALVIFGVLKPTGAATYNFATDFLPIFNALRIGLKMRS